MSLRTDTVYKKVGHQRDPKGTKNVIVVDFNGKPHKSYSSRGESHEVKKAMNDKAAKMLKKDFGIVHELY